MSVLPGTQRVSVSDSYLQHRLVSSVVLYLTLMGNLEKKHTSYIQYDLVSDITRSGISPVFFWIVCVFLNYYC